MAGDDFALTASWGRKDASEAVMPGTGLQIERSYTASTRPKATLGDTTFDIHLNARAYWRNVPAKVWNHKLGGYQVLKKWLSYRERNILGRPSNSRKCSTSPIPPEESPRFLLLMNAAATHEDRSLPRLSD